MDRKLSSSEETERLIRVAEQARRQLAGGVISLQQRLDVPSRVKKSLRERTSTWILGSAVSGLAASLLFRGGRGGRATSPKKRRSFPLALAGLILTAVRPLVKVWFADKVKNYLGGQMGSRPLVGNSRPTTPS